MKLTVDQAATKLNVHINTVRYHIRTGTLQAKKFGRQLEIDSADLAKITGLKKGWAKGRPRK